MRRKAIIYPAAEGGYRAEVPALKACYAEGDTREEVLANLHQAAEDWLKTAAAHKRRGPRRFAPRPPGSARPDGVT